MYQLIKILFFKIFFKKFIFKNEFFFRKIYSLLYIGKSHQCNICQIHLRKFILNKRNELLCPKCGSLNRDRRLWKILESDFLIKNCFILDFSPSRSLYRKLKSIGNFNYSSTDLSGNFFADFNFDITNLPMEKDKYDLIICYHILEHIDNDLLAMSEIYRVLKPHGIAIIQTPFKSGDVYENDSIKTPEERLKHFGQEDHVRIYSEKELKNRLEKTSFTVSIKHFNMQENYHGLLQNETIFVVTKVKN